MWGRANPQEVTGLGGDMDVMAEGFHTNRIGRVADAIESAYVCVCVCARAMGCFHDSQQLAYIKCLEGAGPHSDNPLEGGATFPIL